MMQTAITVNFAKEDSRIADVGGLSIVRICDEAHQNFFYDAGTQLERVYPHLVATLNLEQNHHALNSHRRSARDSGACP
jgi:hypothetical protein